MKFSVIIPAYNASRYINEAIESVIFQKYEQVELIIINDGSTDQTQKQCEDYAEKDKRIRVYNKKNEGVSVARNCGIDMATGDYLLFLDADDKLADNILDNLYKHISSLTYNPDIIFGYYKLIDMNSKEVKNCYIDYEDDFEEWRNLDIWKKLFDKNIVFVAPMMSQIYRREIIVDNNIYFDNSLFVSEDNDWRFHLFTYSQRYSVIKTETYLYRSDNVNSITNMPQTYKKYECNNKFLIRWHNRALKDEKLYPIKGILLRRIGELYANYAIGINNIKNNIEKKQAIQLFRENINLLEYAKGKKYYITNKIYRYFGVNIYLYTINKAHKVKKLTSIKVK